jgi:hypothetical protein
MMVHWNDGYSVNGVVPGFENHLGKGIKKRQFHETHIRRPHYASSPRFHPTNRVDIDIKQGFHPDREV